MDTPDVERHPAAYDYRERFPDLAPVVTFEGGALYTATEAGRPVLISDESTVADLLGESPADEDLAVISIRHFATHAERSAHLGSRFGGLSERELAVLAPTTAREALERPRTRGTPPAGAFKRAARATQAAFRATLPAEAQTPNDDRWAAHDFLLAIGHEDQTLYPTLRDPGGALDYFAARGAQWWRGSRTGDAAGERGPTRNLTSSQVACVNLFLPLRDEPALLAAMLRVFDQEIVGVAPVEFTAADGQPLASYVELEWTGRDGTLEGTGSRGAHATSADAFLIGVTAAGARRGFLVECKYTESYTDGASKGGTARGAVRRRACYAERYAAPSSSFSAAAPLDDVLYEPFYQIVRLGLLGDRLREDTVLNLSDARVAVVCPAGNSAYRDRVTSPPLRDRFPHDTTVAAVARRLWKRPEGFAMVDPADLVAAVRAVSDRADVRAWGDYMRVRYGW